MRTLSKLFLLFIFSFVARNAFAQNHEPVKVYGQKLPPEINYADANRNDTISITEAFVVFNQYLSNNSRNFSTDLTDDVEAVLIDLISYLETINCSAIKKTAGSKRFIELYYVEKFSQVKTI